MTQAGGSGVTGKSFTTLAKSVIKRIPRGRVVTYGQVAALAGSPRGARQVAWILHSSAEKYDLPWHRVINSNGRISLPRGYGYELQKSLLERERIVFDCDDNIDLKRYGWQPKLKPAKPARRKIVRCSPYESKPPARHSRDRKNAAAPRRRRAS